MKIKTLAAMCKREGAFCLYDRVDSNGEVMGQWLGTTAAVYPLSGVPYLTEENLAALFDITEKQAEKIRFTHAPLPAGINFDDTDKAEAILDREKMTLGYGARIVRPLFTRGGLEFIDNDFLSPLADVADVLELFERRTLEGQTYFAAKVGLLIVGVFMPLSIIETKFVENMETMAANCRAALNVKIEREARREKERGEQTSIDGEE